MVFDFILFLLGVFPVISNAVDIQVIPRPSTSGWAVQYVRAKEAVQVPWPTIMTNLRPGDGASPRDSEAVGSGDQFLRWLLPAGTLGAPAVGGHRVDSALKTDDRRFWH
jgi:hypothetical protein